MREETNQWTIRIPKELEAELLLVLAKHPELKGKKASVAIYAMERGIDAIAQEIMEKSDVQKAVIETVVELSLIREGMVTVLALLNSAPANVIDRSQVGQRKAEVEEALRNKGVKR